MKKYYFIILAICLTSCGMQPLTKTPTLTSPYIHYTPTAASNIHLEFDYPSSWTFSENLQNADFMSISLGDPRFLSLPTPDSDDLHPTPNDFGNIAIFITPSGSNETADTELELHKHAYKDGIHRKMLKDYKIIMDGYDASVLECRLDPLEPYTSFMFERRIFFIVENQKYEIVFTVAEKERGDEFEKGYEYFLNSLKINP